MILFLLHSGCLINQSLYDRRYEELTAGEDDSAAPDDTACTPISVWVDVDGDGWGSPDYPDSRCGDLTGWATEGGDCDDADPAVNPGAVEVCDLGIDQDCDGRLSECRLEGDIDVGDADVTWAGAIRPFRVGDLSADGHADAVFLTNTTAYVIQDPADGTSALDESTPSIVLQDADGFAFFDATAGDFDGDGTRELVIGSISGEVFEPSTVYWIDVPSLGSTAYTTDARGEMTGDGAHVLGFSLATSADVDGDGADELIVSEFDTTDPGSVHVLQPDRSFGTAEALATYVGQPSEVFGYAVASGDTNDDGIADLVVTAPMGEAGAGAVYVILGPLVGASGSVDDIDTRIRGGAIGDALGASLTFDPIVDADGDGDADLLIGAFEASTMASAAGAAYLFTGPLGSSLDITDAVGTYLGAHAEAGLGWVVCGADDVDGDGRGDLLIGANPPSSSDTTGRAYLMYGPATGTFLESDLDVTFRPEAGGNPTRLGHGPIVPGDMDGDGLDEILISDPLAAAGIGASYLFRGSGF